MEVSFGVWKEGRRLKVIEGGNPISYFCGLWSFEVSGRGAGVMN
jgi:hypothetical protein